MRNTIIFGIVALATAALGCGDSSPSTAWTPDTATSDALDDVEAKDPPPPILGPVEHQRAGLVASWSGRTCSIGADARVWCWGGEQRTAEPIEGLAGVSHVSAGHSAMCAIVEADGSVWCWRAGIALDSFQPIQIEGFSDAVQAQPGTDGGAAVTSTGELWRWPDGALDTEGRPAPAFRVETAPPLFALSVGSPQYALDELGGLVGVYEPHGVLDDDLPQLIAVATDGIYRAAAVTAEGELWWWRNISYRTTTPRPYRVPDVTDAIDVAVSGEVGCIVHQDGGVSCWDRHPGPSDVIELKTPELYPIEEIADAEGLTLGYSHRCASGKDRRVVCWGWYDYAQLGHGQGYWSEVPLPVQQNSSIAGAAAQDRHFAIAAGSAATWSLHVGIDIDGELREWGEEIGSTYTWTDWTGAPAQYPGPYTKLSMNGSRACALQPDGLVHCQPTAGPTSAAVSGGTVTDIAHAVDVAAGGEHTCVAHDIGAVRCWGANTFGQIGSAPSQEPSKIPRPVEGLPAVELLAAGNEHTCAVDDNGDVWCWGNNHRLQLGVEGFAARSFPELVPGISGVVAIDAGGHTTCAVDGAGQGWCWGADYRAEWLEDVEPLAGPTPIATAWPLVDVGVGRYHACAVTEWTDGHGAVCWGDNRWGQLGDGSREPSEEARVVPLDIDVLEVAAGDHHSCAVDSHPTGGPGYCWGLMTGGRLGNGYPIVEEPVEVIGLPPAL